MNSNVKSSVTILFTLALLTGAVSVAYLQPIYAVSLGELNLDSLSGLNLFKGPKGDPGPQGPSGPQKEFKTITVSKTFTYPISDELYQINAFVPCPEGTEVTGGGHGDINSDVILRSEQPFNNGWLFTGQYNRGGTFTVYAQCGYLIDPGTT